ncbi:MAG: hypothetical protein WCP46_06740, partial [Alphaproteobacteria bacterium]
EDDILIKRENIEYWINGREILRNLNLYPSFLRVEKKNGDEHWYSSDALTISYAKHLPIVNVLDTNYSFLNLPYPYQGMYFYDRELMAEYLNSAAHNPDSGSKWLIRERANQGLTFFNFPDGFISRNVIGFDIKNKMIDSRALIHHLPNTYANHQDKTMINGSIKVNELIVGDFENILHL